MEMERESEMKRGRSQIETGEAGRKKVAGQIKTNPKPPPTSLFASEMKLLEEMRLKHAVSRLNAENPGAPPIVLEALTEEQRALLLQQENKWREEGKAQRYAEALMAHEAEMARQPPPPPEDPDQDVDERKYSLRRQLWERKRATRYGSFDQTTEVPAMCFTDNPMPSHTNHRTTMHIFAVKVAKIAADLRWPLAVYGMVAVRDKLDYRRNIIFDRTRDNCQTLKEQDPYYY